MWRGGIQSDGGGAVELDGSSQGRDEGGGGTEVELARIIWGFCMPLGVLTSWC
jgi:hypothetical protein